MTDTSRVSARVAFSPVGAASGGVFFLVKSVQLVRQPGPKAAMANFFASLLQLGLLQAAAVADRLLLG